MRATPNKQAPKLRIRELEAVNDGLRQELDTASRRLQLIMSQLATVEERAGHGALAEVIRTVAGGQSPLSFDAAWTLLGEFASEVSRHPGAGARLGSRERQVLRLLTEGKRSACIATELGIAIATVEVHRRNIMRKLGLHSVAELTKYAVREGLTSL